jgi:LmbE family N-acetylglucosaminyl deacetylase
MPDHTLVSKLVCDAAFAATCPSYKSEVPTAANLVPIYYMDTLAGVNFNPTEYVDITDCIDKKLDMLECHVSQIKWMRDHDHIDFAEFVRTCARFRGLQSGVQYAEAFTPCFAWPKVTCKRMLP